MAFAMRCCRSACSPAGVEAVCSSASTKISVEHDGYPIRRDKAGIYLISTWSGKTARPARVARSISPHHGGNEIEFSCVIWWSSAMVGSILTPEPVTTLTYRMRR